VTGVQTCALPIFEDRRARDIGGGFEVTCDLSFNLLEGLREGRFDLVVAMTNDAPAEGAVATWRERLTWVGRREAVGRKGTTEPLRLVAEPEGCLYRRQMVTSLQRVGRACEIVYTSPSLPGLEAAVVSGFGVSVFAERIVPERLRALPPLTGLPTLNDLMVGIYLGKGERRSEAMALAAHLAELLGTGD
jgi:DNA-binding transcriptional LysR family regulator